MIKHYPRSEPQGKKKIKKAKNGLLRRGNIMRFAGTVPFKLDPLTWQKEIRSEWE